MGEYDQWVAQYPIFIDRVLAYAKGDPVPASVVSERDLGSLVGRPGDEPPKPAYAAPQEAAEPVSVLRLSFDGSITVPRPGVPAAEWRTYEFRRDGRPFAAVEVDPQDAPAFFEVLDGSEERAVDLDAIPDDLDVLKKPELVDLADTLGLDAGGTVADLRGRVEAWVANEPSESEPLDTPQVVEPESA